MFLFVSVSFKLSSILLDIKIKLICEFIQIWIKIHDKRKYIKRCMIARTKMSHLGRTITLSLWLQSSLFPPIQWNFFLQGSECFYVGNRKRHLFQNPPYQIRVFESFISSSMSSSKTLSTPSSNDFFFTSSVLIDFRALFFR